MKEMILNAEIARMDDVLDFINAEREAHDVPMKTIMQLDIAIEEIFVNIAHYAYNPEIGQAAITVDVDDAARSIAIRFMDRGKPYDPLSREDPDVTLDVEERQIGGLGIYMVKKSMDEVTYTYEGGQNVLTIRKRF